MTHLLAVVLRLVVLGVLLTAYYAAMPYLFPGEQDANIGAGLLAFALVALVCGLWGIVDGRARGAATATAIWAVVAVVFGVLWLVGLALVESDDSMTVSERLQVDAFLMVFMGSLVLAPALIGVAIGRALGGASGSEG